MSAEETKNATAELEAGELRAEVERLRAMLREKDELIRVIMDHNPDGIAILEPSGKVFANPACSRFFMLDAAVEVAPHEWSAHFGIFGHDGVTPMALEEMPMSLAAQGASISDAMMFVRNAACPDGAWLNASARPIEGGGAISVLRDVTEQKRLEDDLAARNEALAARDAEKTRLVERLRLAVDELSTPVLDVWDEVLALPIIGVLDAERSARMVERLLDQVTERRSRFVIVDLTGVELVDASTADQIVNMVRAVRLLGAEFMLSGIQPRVASMLVDLGVEFRGFRTTQTLKQALEMCMQARRE